MEYFSNIVILIIMMINDEFNQHLTRMDKNIIETLKYFQVRFSIL